MHLPQFIATSMTKANHTNVPTTTEGNIILDYAGKISLRLECTLSGYFSSYFTTHSLEYAKVPALLIKISTLHQHSKNREKTIFSLNFKLMSSSRFKCNLLEYSLHPIITYPSIKENYCIYCHLATKERYYSTLVTSLFLH